MSTTGQAIEAVFKDSFSDFSLEPYPEITGFARLAAGESGI